MTRQIGYCTNVHAGPDLAATRANLQQYAVPIKQRVCGDASMGVGLWLAAPAAEKLLDDHSTDEFANWLAEVGLVPFTLNGFPYGDFHQVQVKHRVYEPTWYEQSRVDYTTNLIRILDLLLPEGLEGSISTLPICWGDPAPTDEQLEVAAGYLRRVAMFLAKLEKDRGRRIHICLEPEPGCLIGQSEDLVRFFKEHLLKRGDEEILRRHLRVCHDVCHAAVMFEDQAEVLARYRAAGIHVGKVQVSSAVCVDFDRIDPSDRAEAFAQLSDFAEDRYLHQTMIQESNVSGSGPKSAVFYEDLPLALATVDDPTKLTNRWRVHFHVPIYLEQFGQLGTSRAQILECLTACDAQSDVSHFEVETYAWDVLPEELKQPSLVDGIAAELQWFREQLA